MAKKADNKKLFFLIALVFAVAAVAMNFLPMIKFHQDLVLEGSYNEVKYTGFNLMFGSEKVVGKAYSALGVAVDYTGSTKLVVVSLIAGILTVLGLVAGLLVKIINKKQQNIVKFVSFGCFVAAAILIFALTKASFVSANEINENLTQYYSLGIGAILGGIFNGIAGVGVLLS